MPMPPRWKTIGAIPLPADWVNIYGPRFNWRTEPTAALLIQEDRNTIALEDLPPNERQRRVVYAGPLGRGGELLPACDSPGYKISTTAAEAETWILNEMTPAEARAR